MSFLYFILILVVIVVGVYVYIMYKYRCLLPYYGNMKTITNINDDYRKVEYTTPTMQLVTMHLLPNEEIGMERHPITTQFIRVESGTGVAEIDGKKYDLFDDMTVIIPPNAKHNITATTDMKLYTIYSPPEHKSMLIQHRK